MKKIYNIVFLLFLLFSIKSFSQAVPNGFSYQSIVRDAVGLPIPNQSVTIRISIHQTLSTGIIIFQEQHTKTTNQFGLVNLIVGSGTISIGVDLNGINWSADKYFVQVEVQNGLGFVDLGTSEFQSVPYSFAAGNTLKIQNTSVSGVVPTANQILQFNGGTGLWEPTNVSGVSLITQTADVTVSGTTFDIGTASGTSFGILSPIDFTNFNNKLSTSTGFGGDISGSFNALTVNGIAGYSITGVSPGSYLVFDGTNFVPISTATGISQWTTTTTGIFYNSGNIAIGANTISGAKLKVNGDLSAGGQVIASASFQPTGTASSTSPALLYKQRVYIPIGTNSINATFNAYEFLANGSSIIQVWIGGVQVGTDAVLGNPNDVNTSVAISDIPVSGLAGTFQTIEIRGRANVASQGVIVQGYTFVINN